MNKRTINTYIYAIRNGVRITELQPRDAPRIVMDATGNINSSFSGSFAPNDDVDWLTDEIQPVLEIDGIKHNCGVFIPTTINRTRSDGISSIEIEAYDKCWTVQSMITSGILHYSAGANYITTIEGLLTQCNIGLISETPTSSTLRFDREDWDLGTDYLTIVNQLLDEINYKPLWFNPDGYAMIEPEKLISAKNAVRSYDTEVIDDLVMDESSLEVDLYDAPNVFICICQNPDDTGSALTATAENDNAASPLSIGRRGKRICKYYNIDNIASQSDLNDYAKLICQDNMLIGEVATMTTGLIPNCGVNDIVSVSHADMSGLYRETGWEMEFTPGGTMKHTLERLVGTLEQS